MDINCSDKTNYNESEKALELYFDRLEPGRSVDIEALCQEFPEHREDLLKLHERWGGPDGSLKILGEGGRSFSQKFKQCHQGATNPEITLHEKPEAEPAPAQALKTSRYQFLGEVARGGMGVILKVWDNDLRRSLAMKVILSQNGDNTSLERFLEEAQVTGQLDHPGIVPVHEMGLDDEGRVYFTMRLVHGQDLRSIFDLVFHEKEGWNRTRALGVLLKVCEAMAFAHTKGVIHRDLKPGNIMVGRYGQVYVMDWGLSKVLGRTDDRDLRIHDPGDEAARPVDTGSTPLLTMDGDVVGTPAYMSPEQARGEILRMDQRTDIYALGAMLYHLLTGRMPYTRPGVGVDGCTVWRWLLEKPPQPILELAADVPVELEAICEKAMAREPDARYASMMDMADDLRAYLENRVVSAYRTGPVVEFKKWVRRNRALAATIALALFLLLGGAAATSLVLAAKNDEITAARDKAESINEFLVNEMLLASTPESAMGKEITVMDVLDNASRRVEAGLDGEVEAAVQHTLGHAYWRLGRSREAVNHLTEAYEVRRKELGEDHRDTLATLSALAWSKFFDGQMEEGEAMLRACWEKRKALFGDEDPDTLQSTEAVAEMLTMQGHPEEAEPLLRNCLEVRQRRSGKNSGTTLGTLHKLVSAVKLQGRLEEAEPLMMEALERMRKSLTNDHPDTVNAINDMACLFHDMGRFDEAEAYYREALEGTVRVYGEDHFMHSVALNNMGTLLGDQSRLENKPALLEQAEANFRKSLEIRRTLYSDDHPLVATGLHNLGGLMYGWGRWGEAEELIREALEIRMKKLGPDHDETIVSLHGLAVVLEGQGKDAEAESVFREVVEAADSSLSPGHWHRGTLRRGLADLLFKQERFTEAEEIYLESYSILSQTVGDDHDVTQKVLIALIDTFDALGKDATLWKKKLASSSGS